MKPVKVIGVRLARSNHRASHLKGVPPEKQEEAERLYSAITDAEAEQAKALDEWSEGGTDEQRTAWVRARDKAEDAHRAFAAWRREL